MASLLTNDGLRMVYAEQLIHYPEDGRSILYFSAQIRYPQSSMTKGDAWKHLWHNPPTIKIAGVVYSPYFEPLENREGKPYRRNPYRQAHNDSDWIWKVKRWTRGEGLPGRAPEPPKTRYDLLMDGSWLNEGWAIPTT